MFIVRQKTTGLYLRMSRFEPGTETPVYGDATEAWIARSKEQAVAQASVLGNGSDHEAVEVVTKLVG